jgi:hypothetical protein
MADFLLFLSLTLLSMNALGFVVLRLFSEEEKEALYGVEGSEGLLAETGVNPDAK